MKNNERKKYFLKDSYLLSIDDDKFNQSVIIKNLRMLIENSEPPFNIALIGKWGLGKSSIINLLLDKYKNSKNNDYIIGEINAWKYEKETMGKVFLKQLLQGVKNEKIKTFEVIKREFSNIIKSDLDTHKTSKDINNLQITIYKVFGCVFVFSAFSFEIYKIIQAFVLNINTGTWTFWFNTFLSYCKNVVTVLLFPIIIALGKILIDEFYRKDSKKIELNFPIETVDDYEIFLDEAIQEKLNINKNLKIITVIDDLDRLSMDKIVEALDAIKAFVGFKRCIFIVPFDDSILKKALEKGRISVLDETQHVIQSELILDKLFQYKIYIPPLLDFDIKKYAVEVVETNIPDFITEYCKMDNFEKIIRKVLVH